MISLIFVAFIGASLAVEPSEDALQSAESLVKLFSAFTAEQGQKLSAAEAPMRLRLFRNELKAVVETNKQDLGWTAGLNFFADLTEEEKQQYLGLNQSLIPQEAGDELPAATSAPSSADWRARGAVTGVKNQGSCGSCWSFAAVGSLEGVHKIATGSLVVFAEQELLDCTYEGRRDGCQGGWYHDAFSYVRSARRLAPSSAVYYAGRDGRCDYRNKQNGLRGTVTGHSSVGRSENGLMSALGSGPVGVAFEVTSTTNRYRGGILRDNSCRGQPNHAVTAVGYDSRQFVIKNSWGGSWGERGYVNMARNHRNCGLYTNNAIVRVSGRGEEKEEKEE